MKIAGIFIFSFVLFDGDTVFQSHGPACADYTGNRDGQWNKETLPVNFYIKQAITWTGYREESIDSPKDAKLFVDLWLAGADTEKKNWFIGVSVRHEDSIYTNSVHPADLTGESESCLAESFCLQTTAR